MKIEIHDVDHGGCAVITGPAGHRLMLDCGQSASKAWFPSAAYLLQPIQTLMVLNLDEDHVQDLRDLRRLTTIKGVFSNPTISAAALRAMKPQGMRTGVQAAHDLLNEFGGGRIGEWCHPLGGVGWHAFWNVYERDFVDTNNLSLAVFVSFGGFTILFGGDLETAGWRKLMEIPAFRGRLLGVNVFVASHHGRDNGICPEVFDWCKPDLIIFSDGAKQYGTQETTPAWYATKANGIPDPNYVYRGGFDPWARRRVMTTRKDGTITMDVGADGRWSVRPKTPDISSVLAQLGLLNNAMTGFPRLG
jgi:beta-lactamase superfamily II metal-dependent hydrolase